MKVWSAVAFFQNFFVGCFKEAITDVVSKIESQQEYKILPWETDAKIQMGNQILHKKKKSHL